MTKAKVLFAIVSLVILEKEGVYSWRCLTRIDHLTQFSLDPNFPGGSVGIPGQRYPRNFLGLLTCANGIRGRLCRSPTRNSAVVSFGPSSRGTKDLRRAML